MRDDNKDEKKKEWLPGPSSFLSVTSSSHQAYTEFVLDSSLDSSLRSSWLIFLNHLSSFPSIFHLTKFTHSVNTAVIPSQFSSRNRDALLIIESLRNEVSLWESLQPLWNSSSLTSPSRKILLIHVAVSWVVSCLVCMVIATFVDNPFPCFLSHRVTLIIAATPFPSIINLTSWNTRKVHINIERKRKPHTHMTISFT